MYESSGPATLDPADDIMALCLDLIKPLDQRDWSRVSTIADQISSYASAANKRPVGGDCCSAEDAAGEVEYRRRLIGERRAQLGPLISLGNWSAVQALAAGIMVDAILAGVASGPGYDGRRRISMT